MKRTRYTVKRKTAEIMIDTYKRKSDACLYVCDRFIQRENDEIDNAIYTLQRMAANYQK